MRIVPDVHSQAHTCDEKTHQRQQQAKKHAEDNNTGKNKLIGYLEWHSTMLTDIHAIAQHSRGEEEKNNLRQSFNSLVFGPATGSREDEKSLVIR